VNCNGSILFALDDDQATGGSAAKGMRFLQYRVEHRREVAGRRIDDPQDVGHRSLSCQSLVVLGSALGELASKVSDDLLRIG